MLTYKDGKWQLATHIVKFTHTEGYREVYTMDVDYWQVFAERWKETFTLHEIAEFTPSQEQKLRYENIKDMPEDFGDIYSQYVEFGTISDHAHLLVSHPFVRLVTSLTERKNFDRITILKDEVVDMKKSMVELAEMLLGGGV